MDGKIYLNRILYIVLYIRYIVLYTLVYRILVCTLYQRPALHTYVMILFISLSSCKLLGNCYVHHPNYSAKSDGLG